MESLQITHFFDVIKKEIVDEDEQMTPVIYDHTSVKQEFHYKEELDLAWDEVENNLDNKENIHALKNSSRKLVYPIVLVERLSYDAANNPFSIHHHENTFGTLNAPADSKKKYGQHYRKICSKCNKIGSSEKPTKKCKNCDTQWIYECKKCLKQCRSYLSIIGHLKSKCLEKGHYFACFKCDYKSIHKSGVNRHLKNVHSIFHSRNRIEKFESDNVQKDTAAKLHKCTKCGDEFQKLPPFLRHMQVCGQPENNTGSYNFAATANEVKGRCVYYCVKCDETVKDDNVGNFQQKKCKSCDTKLYFNCNECNKIFASYNGINKHLKISHSVSEDVFKCHQCDYKTAFFERLTNHVFQTHPMDTQGFQCDTCPYRSKTKHALKRHIANAHIGGNEIECPQCKSTLKNKCSLTNHLRYCKKQARHECSKCSFNTKYRTNLAKHYENVHSSFLTKSEQCPHCVKEFKNKHSLRQHLRYWKKMASFSCKYSSSLFQSKHDLKDHLVQVYSKDDDVDSAVKVAYFYCDKCTYKSKFKGNLVKHVSIHLDNPEEDCPRCGKTYKNERSLRFHLRFCGTDPDLQCDFCSYKTKYKCNLKKHIESKHPKAKKPRLE